MKKIIHINQHIIKQNRKNGTRLPTITVKTYKNTYYATEVFIAGPCKIVYSPDKPLKYNGEVWIETEDIVEILNPGKERIEV